MIGEIMYSGDRACLTLRRIRIKHFEKDGQIRMDWLSAWRDRFHANHVLKTQEYFHFCRVIDDAEIVENG
jgi:hypothetical protein